MDCVVCPWLYGTLSGDLLDIVMRRGDSSVTARATWLAIESQFLGNREARALILDTKLRTLVQGDLSVVDYCKRLKTTADDLADLGEPVTNRSLVLNLIRGLNERFSSIGCHLRRGHPFPSFLEACDELALEELTMGNSPTQSTTLVAGTGGGPSSRPSAPTSQQPSGRTGSASGVKKGRSSSTSKGGRGNRGKGGRNGGKTCVAKGGSSKIGASASGFSAQASSG
ncbi:uncharacterized protein LOC120684975 [Panicum virgatum]|uniref:uncharacterized protein LOC120684975 n=1 Tax=Panicum virgatum TaxID=38727 RepID=UPI0019D55156|nr:uncharacterized protein LOC120684975 [Panicum virgatum]